MLKKISIAVAGAVLMTFGMGTSAIAANFNFEVLASGLDSPRGITFGPDGAHSEKINNIKRIAIGWRY